MSTPLVARFHAQPTAPIEDSLVFATGTMRDYAALCEHHYRAERPATATRVLVLRHVAHTAASRFRGFLGLPPPAQTVGVLVESLPALCCRLRDEALGPRFANLRDPRARAVVLNKEIRCISRVVVHPSWRGVGLAVRLVRAALATAQTPYTEALAAMGKVHPFFERAGMTAYHRPPHEHDDRLAAALGRIGLTPASLVLLDAAWAHIQSLPQPERDWLFMELRRWHARTRRNCRGDPPGMEFDIFRGARKRLWCEPVYYVCRNPSLKRSLS